MGIGLLDIILIGIALIFVFISYSIGWIKNKKIKLVVKIVWFGFLMLILLLIVNEIILRIQWNMAIVG